MTPRPLPLIPRLSVPLDENGFVDWLVDAEPGDVVAYYRGHLAYDRMPTAEVLPRAVKSNLVGVARRVLAAYDQGLVIPVQKRIGPEDFLYLAVKAVPGLNRRAQAARASAPARTAANDETPLPLAA